MMHTFVAIGIMTVLWVAVSYSMSFGSNVLGGWFGFNAGSSVSSSLSTAQALAVTQVAAAAGTVGWIVAESLHQRKATVLGFISGILAGLVIITPAAGVVQPLGAIVLGFSASLSSYIFVSMKHKFKLDDTLDVFGIHGVAAIFGAVFLVFFIRDSWMQDAAIANNGSWTIFEQLGVQVAAVTIAITYTAIVTLIILLTVNKITKFRANDIEEMKGLDTSYHGERGYGMLNPN